ncbi:MAG: MFS transporter [Rhodospirillales bacterium]|nr:MFS transporter [Rhodospirillales bacterium]
MSIRSRRAAVLPRRNALRFIVLLGLVSLFADMTYEGARSITGPYLAFLGASATVVGLVAGAGELMGYALRLASGYLSDRTGRYWPITIFGYALNLLAVPALALTGRWELAVILIVAERVGKAIRSPARDAMLSHASSQTGLGWGFGLHEAMDQVGAIAGPLILSAVLAYGHGYREAFGILLVPAVLSMSVLLAARYLFPRPQDLDLTPEPPEAKGLPPVFWVYMLAVAFVAAGYADYALIAFHFDKSGAAPTVWIPVLYAIAMATDAVAALALGRAYDRVGLWAMVAATVASAASAPLVFLGDLRLAAAGMALWGLGMGAQESVMRAAVAAMAPRERRGTAFGTMNMIYGFAWFGGSAVLGILYDQTSALWVAVASAALQLASIPVFIRLIKRA